MCLQTQNVNLIERTARILNKVLQLVPGHSVMISIILLLHRHHENIIITSLTTALHIPKLQIAML